MLSYITLKNFKCFEEQSFALSNLTIVAGANGAGKSTLIQSLLLLRQSALDRRSLLSEKVQLNGSLVKLNSAEGIRYFESEDTDINFMLEDDDIEKALDVTIVDAITTEPTCETRVSENLDEYVEKCDLFSKDMVYLAPDRMSPGDIHTARVNDDPVLGRMGDKMGYSAAARLNEAQKNDEKVAIIALDRSGDGRVTTNVSAWMSYIMDFNYVVKVSEKDKDNLEMSYTVEANGVPVEVSPFNMPFGNSSIFPIVVALMTAPKDSLVVIENPEAHIHPKAQTKMGELLAIAAENGVQIIIETHSDHLLNGVRIAIKQKKIDENGVEIHFVYADRDNPIMHHTQRMQIHEDGSIDEWPRGFFDEWELSLRTLTQEQED